MYRAPIVRKAFQILELVAKRNGLMTISDLSRELGISKSTVYGIAQALEEAGALMRDEKTKRYTLGTAVFDLARTAHARLDLKDVARPYMETLMSSTRQSVFLGLRSGDHISIVDIVESTRDLKITAPVGTRLPLLAGAIGKVFMASMHEEEAERLIRGVQLRHDTEKSITDANRYLTEIRITRERGYALDDEEYMQGVRAVAAPIRALGRQTSAIWVVGFTASMSAERMNAIAMETKRAAEAISRKVDLQPFEGQGR
jgi:DNA-binding IclR family transcriptional regulator